MTDSDDLARRLVTKPTGEYLPSAGPLEQLRSADATGLDGDHHLLRIRRRVRSLDDP
jgi:hypothetical protein